MEYEDIEIGKEYQIVRNIHGFTSGDIIKVTDKRTGMLFNIWGKNISNLSIPGGCNPEDIEKISE